MTLLNSAVAEAVSEVASEIKKLKGSKPYPSEDEILEVVRHFIKLTKPVRFEGDNYSAEWALEAEERGLPNIKNSPVAFSQLLKPVHSSTLIKQGIFSEDELKARHNILCEKYTKDLLVEAKALHSIVNQQVLPAAFQYRRELADTFKSLDNEGGLPERIAFDELTPVVLNLQKASLRLAEAIKSMETHGLTGTDEEDSAGKEANHARDHLVPAMDAARKEADLLEGLVSDKLWPLPKYQELLFYA